jgi:hypothetical protein
MSLKQTWRLLMKTGGGARWLHPKSDLVSIFLKVESLKREETAGQASEPVHSFRRFALIGAAEIS